MESLCNRCSLRNPSAGVERETNATGRQEQTDRRGQTDRQEPTDRCEAEGRTGRTLQDRR